jgi:hypothetical protein
MCFYLWKINQLFPQKIVKRNRQDVVNCTYVYELSFKDNSKNLSIITMTFTFTVGFAQIKNMELKQVRKSLICKLFK